MIKILQSVGENTKQYLETVETCLPALFSSSRSSHSNHLISGILSSIVKKAFIIANYTRVLMLGYGK
jgi:hypothetical protein